MSVQPSKWSENLFMVGGRDSNAIVSHGKKNQAVRIFRRVDRNRRGASPARWYLKRDFSSRKSWQTVRKVGLTDLRIAAGY